MKLTNSLTRASMAAISVASLFGTRPAFPNSTTVASSPVSSSLLSAAKMHPATSPDAYANFGEQDWSIVKLRRNLPGGGTMHAELLRPNRWLATHGVREGEGFFFSASESALSGEALVTDITAARELPSSNGFATAEERTVTGVFRISGAKTYSLTVSDGTTARATGIHPLFSIDRGAWVTVDSLRPGERLKTKSGETTVTALEANQALEDVFNLEVHGDHVYIATDARLLSHNVNGCEGDPSNDTLDAFLRRASLRRREGASSSFSASSQTSASNGRSLVDERLSRAAEAARKKLQAQMDNKASPLDDLSDDFEQTPTQQRHERSDAPAAPQTSTGRTARQPGIVVPLVDNQSLSHNSWRSRFLRSPFGNGSKPPPRVRDWDRRRGSLAEFVEVNESR